jgi:hypothetical protein
MSDKKEIDAKYLAVYWQVGFWPKSSIDRQDPSHSIKAKAHLPVVQFGSHLAAKIVRTPSI